MSAEDIKRKLTAIFSADVEGYSRLMGDDEIATVQTLTSYKETMRKLINHYRGRVVDSTGDNLLAEFVSVVDAVQCAVEVQQILNSKNESLPENRRMLFRIGINLGDVIEEDDRIFGDGVNIAARVESLSEGGGVCISGSAYEQIENKLALGYQYMGEHTVKNINKPIKVWKVPMGPFKEKKKIAVRGWQKVAITAAAILILAGVAGVIWHFYFRPVPSAVEIASEAQPIKVSPEPSSTEVSSKALPGLPLPDKPSIAVMPLTNISANPEQEYFSDGMTDTLITDLSKISGLFVIARNSVFTYKGKSVKVEQIGRELGVRYVLEGSVQRAGNQVRINAQLIDTTTGGHLWADRYDGDMGDVFDLQDKITQKIVAALAVKLTTGEEKQVGRKHTDNVAAYDAFLQGRALYVRRTPDDFAKAVRYFEKAIKLDPNYGRAYAALALTYWESSHNFWSQSLKITWPGARMQAESYLQTAMNNPTALTYQVASKMLTDWHDHEEAIGMAQRSIALDPNDANSYLAMAYALIYAGRPEEAFDFVESAVRLDPRYPAYFLYVLGLAHFGMEQFEEAATSFERALKRNPINYVPLIYLAAAYGHLGREQEAAAATEELNKVMPFITLQFVSRPFMSRYRDPVDNDRLLDGLRKAGLPETPFDVLKKAGE